MGKIKQMLKNEYALILIVITVLAVSFLLITFFGKTSFKETPPVATTTPTVRSFPNVNILAKAAAVYDVESKKFIFEKNINTQLPLASVTKLVTALTASDFLLPDDNVTITKEALLTTGDSGLLEGELWRFKDLLDFTLVSSSNDGAKAIAIKSSQVSGEDFVLSMNKKISSIGLKQTYFINETGLDLNSSLGGSYGSSRDMAKLLEYIWKSELHILEATSEKSLLLNSYQFAHKTENTSTIVDSIPGLIGSKTGFTDLAEGNLAIIFDRGVNQPVAVVVLGSSLDGRFNDVLRLVEETLNYFETKQ